MNVIPPDQIGRASRSFMQPVSFVQADIEWRPRGFSTSVPLHVSSLTYSESFMSAQAEESFCDQQQYSDLKIWFQVNTSSGRGLVYKHRQTTMCMAAWLLSIHSDLQNNKLNGMDRFSPLWTMSFSLHGGATSSSHSFPLYRSISLLTSTKLRDIV